MKSCNLSLPLGRHVSAIHDRIFPKISFLILDHIHPGTRSGDWIKTLLQHEQRWIFHLNTARPPGLNESISFRPFLEGFASGGSEWVPNDTNLILHYDAMYRYVLVLAEQKYLSWHQSLNGNDTYFSPLFYCNLKFNFIFAVILLCGLIDTACFLTVIYLLWFSLFLLLLLFSD